MTKVSSSNPAGAVDEVKKKKPKDFSSNWKNFLKTHSSEVKRIEKKNVHKSSVNRKFHQAKKTMEEPKKINQVVAAVIEPKSAPNSSTEVKPVTKDMASELCKPNSFSGPTKVLSIDCEMVEGKDKRNLLARVSLVNCFGHCVYDKYVKPTDVVTDYRTKVSGIRPSDLESAEDFVVVRREVMNLTRGRILVGHGIVHDLEVLEFNHPFHMRRDTSTYPPFMDLNNGKKPGLSMLADKILGMRIQDGEHSSVIDAQAAMKLYMMHKTYWK